MHYYTLFTLFKFNIANYLDASITRYTLLVAGEDWITLEEAAEKLHVVLETMRRWVRLGYFPRTRVGKRYLVPRQAVVDFLERNIQHGPRPVTPRKKEQPELAQPEAAGEEPKPEAPGMSMRPGFVATTVSNPAKKKA
jgi:excisionase family DNA binding protein